MRRLLPLVLALLAGTLGAQSIPAALLWRIVPVQGGDTSFLYGTMHSTDDRAFRHVAMVQEVLPRCATVAGELDLNGAGNVALGLMDRLMLPAGTELKRLYSPKQWKRFEPALREQLGAMMAPMMGRMKPIFILATLSQGDMAADHARMLDDALMEDGRTLDKHVIGLESVEEQMAALDAIPLDEQARLLHDHVLGDGSSDDLDALHDAYAVQDLDRIWRLTNKAATASTAFEKALLTDRNKVLVHRMDSVMASDGNALFLIGAAHLPGPDGLIEGLRARGHALLPVLPASGTVPVQRSTRRAPHLE